MECEGIKEAPPTVETINGNYEEELLFHIIRREPRDHRVQSGIAVSRAETVTVLRLRLKSEI